AGVYPFVTAFGERDDDRLELQPPHGEHVFRLFARGARLPALHEAGRDESLEALRQNIGGDSEAFLELGVARAPGEHRVPQDEQAPAFADQLERPSGRAILIPVETA